MAKLTPFYRIAPKKWRCLNNGYVAAEQKKAIENPELSEYQIEEYVRQWILNELVITYGYPEEWIADDGVSGRIYLEWEVAMGVEYKRADIALLNEWRRPFLFIETKNRSIDIFKRPTTNKPSAVEQVQSYTAVVLEANVCIATNGEQMYAGRIQVDPTQFVNYPDIPSYEKSNRAIGNTTIVKGKEEIIEGRAGDGLSTAINFSSILGNIHDVLRGDENLQPDEALDEMCKLMFVKFYDELTTKENESYKFQEYLYGNAEELGSSIRTLYINARNEENEKLKRRGKYDASKSAFDEKIIIKDNTIKRIVHELQDYS